MLSKTSKLARLRWLLFGTIFTASIIAIVVASVLLWNASAVGAIRMISVYDFPPLGGRPIVYRVDNQNSYSLENGNVSKSGHLEINKYVDYIKDLRELHWQRYKYVKAAGTMIAIAGSKNEPVAFFPAGSASVSPLARLAKSIENDVRQDFLSSAPGHSEAFGKNARLKTVTLRPINILCSKCRTATFTSEDALLLSYNDTQRPIAKSHVPWTSVLKILREQRADEWIGSSGAAIIDAGGLEIAFNSDHNAYLVQVGDVRSADRNLAIGVARLEHLIHARDASH